MGLISEVKCARCDRRYSGLRSKCPYCGARRSQRGKRSSDGDNNIWKFVIGLLLLVILIAAVIVLVVSSLSAKGGGAQTSGETSSETSGANTENQGVTNVGDPNKEVTSGETSAATSGETSGETSAPASAVESIALTYLGSEIAYKGTDTNYEISMSAGDTITLGYITTPADATVADGDAVWSSSDSNSVIVLQTGEVTAVGTSSATVTLTIGSVTATCLIRVS